MTDLRRGSEWERLWAGARLGRIDIVERLAPKWAGFAPIHENNQTALMVACEAGQVEAAKTLLPWSNPDAMEPGGGGALMAAVRGKNPACVSLMLGASNLARPTPYGVNALIDAFRQAAALGDKEVCSLLQAASGGKDEPWRDGSRSADVARERGHVDLALAIEARAAGASLEEALPPVAGASSFKPRL